MNLADGGCRTLIIVPFIPFVVLVGNAVSTSSEIDMALLNVAIQLMRPVAVDSPLVRCVCRECDDLFRMAGSIIL
jgi:hypothetical protein